MGDGYCNMKTIHLLTIGNSLAENPLTYLADIARSEGSLQFEIGRCNLSGCSLKKHWNLALYTQTHPEHKTYQLDLGMTLPPVPGGKQRSANLQEALVAEPWDYVTLNQGSLPGWRRETFQPYLGFLHDLVRELAPQAQIFLNQTWAYRSDAPYLPQNGLTEELMLEHLRANYAAFAAELGCRLIPCGEAVQQVRRAPGRIFSWPDPEFDFQNAEAPTLPRQEHSLSIGWNWIINDSMEGVPDLSLDFNHLNAAGCYLTGCTWFECLTSLDVRPVTFRPSEVDAGYATFLRENAHDVSRRYGPLPKD